MRLLLAETKDFSTEIISKLQSVFELTLANDSMTQKEFIESFAKYEIIWFKFKYNLKGLEFIQNIKCKIIVSPVTGINHLELCKKINIKIISLKGEEKFLKTIRPTAEHTIFLCMALMRKSIKSSIDVLNGEWDRDRFRGNELYKKKIGIIGYGRLGKIVAKYFLSLGCRVSIYDTKKIKPELKSFFVCKTLEELINDSDVLSIHADLNKDNLNIFNNNIINKMKKGVFIINTSRGEILNEKDIVEGLNNKIIAGIAVDVIINESDYKSSPLFKSYLSNKHNIIITPHIGGNTFESFYRTEKFIFNKLLNEIK